MRIEMVFHSYIDVFNRLISVRFDLTDWEFKIKKTNASILFYCGPIHLGYTNQNKVASYINDLLKNIDKDFDNYQVLDTTNVVSFSKVNPNELN